MWVNLDMDTILFPLHYLNLFQELGYLDRVRHLEAEWVEYEEFDWPERRIQDEKTPFETFESIQSLTITIRGQATPEWLALRLMFELYHTCDPTRLDIRILYWQTNKCMTRDNYKQVHRELVEKGVFDEEEMAYFYFWTHGNCSCVTDSEA